VYKPSGNFRPFNLCASDKPSLLCQPAVRVERFAISEQNAGRVLMRKSRAALPLVPCGLISKLNYHLPQQKKAEGYFPALFHHNPDKVSRRTTPIRRPYTSIFTRFYASCQSG